ncbi:hypothetical protein HDU93_006649 [Gonapodya sp. JEL0774]|nr:hypothetical protein HDU93_006649 [Gonapodya sp. JEL0774]
MAQAYTLDPATDAHMHAEQLILCCVCGVAIAPNPAAMCSSCLRNEVDITEGIPKSSTLNYCRDCERYLQPPSMWVNAELESRELLAVCLKRLRGLSKVRLVDAGFVWTEPHSRRVKVKLTIQKEVTHKRTFLWLEQVILKNGAHKDTVNIKEAKDGIDFYYGQRTHAIRMVDFLSAVVPLRSKSSETIISSDIHQSTANFKYTYSVELVPLCRDDLVCLPPKLSRQLGMMGPLVLVSKISNSVQLVDPNTLKVADLRNQQYWESPVVPLADAGQLVEFYVIDVQLDGPRHGKNALASVEVSRSNDVSTTFLARTHLGNLLNAGDHAMGYDLTNANFNNPSLTSYLESRSSKFSLPDVILVKKSFPHRRRRAQPRHWKIKHLGKEEEEERGKRERGGADKDKDLELFLRDLEEDEELRGMVNLYKAQDRQALARRSDPDAMQDTDPVDEDDGMDEESEVEPDFPEIRVDELLEDMERLTVNDEEI